jgi:hypothetical protein
MFYLDCGGDPCVWEHKKCAIFEYADSYLPTYQPLSWQLRRRLSYTVGTSVCTGRRLEISSGYLDMPNAKSS